MTSIETRLFLHSQNESLDLWPLKEALVLSALKSQRLLRFAISGTRRSSAALRFKGVMESCFCTPKMKVLIFSLQKKCLWHHVIRSFLSKFAARSCRGSLTFQGCISHKVRIVNWDTGILEVVNAYFGGLRFTAQPLPNSRFVCYFCLYAPFSGRS